VSVKYDIVEVRIPFDKIEDEAFIRQKIRARKKNLGKHFFYRINKRSIDARQKIVYYLLRLEVSDQEFVKEDFSNLIRNYPTPNPKKQVLIVGAGPAGYFAALECLRLGLVPTVLDRGKDVRARRRDLKSIQQDHIVNPHSNYCFGEGGAGTYSDGKLYTRSHKRGKIQGVLELLVAHGAKRDILIDAHPHIGSNKLPGIVSNIRETIEANGGKVIFNCFVTDLIIEEGKIKGAITYDGTSYRSNATILATGHSARDIYHLLDQKSIAIEAKPFAIGVRIEHPQVFIDKAQYGQEPRSEFLPAAPYKLVTQVEDKGVFSFCMCPGGLIVPASTAPGEIVVNGMSLSKRDSPYANSGVVTEISLEDLEAHGYTGTFAGINLQKEIEQKVFSVGDGSQKAPSQRLEDFVNRKISESLPKTSYIPGIYSAQVSEVFPEWIHERLRAGIQAFDKKLKGYLSNEAIVVATESRTSSPIKIPRNRETFMHDGLDGFFPCGEGAGYAGGILSAAMDGQNVAKGVAKYLSK